jgi:hypothetical protein
MRRLLAGIGLAAGLAWLLGRRRRPAPAGPAADPADELKQKLAESRSFAEEPVPAPEPSLDDRRSEVHDRARASIDRMRETGQPPPAESE